MLEERPRLDRAVELGELLEERAHVLQRHRVGPVGHRLRRVRMRFHEDAGNADRDCSAGKHGNELALAARRRALAAGQLHRMRRVEHDGIAETTHHR